MNRHASGEDLEPYRASVCERFSRTGQAVNTGWVPCHP